MRYMKVYMKRAHDEEKVKRVKKNIRKREGKKRGRK